VVHGLRVQLGREIGALASALDGTELDRSQPEDQRLAMQARSAVAALDDMLLTLTPSGVAERQKKRRRLDRHSCAEEHPSPCHSHAAQLVSRA
jgi:hypothetical protein